VELDLSGSETELDNNIIQQISDPLVHSGQKFRRAWHRNSRERREVGKPELGRVMLRAYHRGNHIYIEVEDDGHGIAYDRVRRAL